MKNDRTCTVDGCDRALVARGLCRRHYARLHRTGQLEAREWQPKSQCVVEGCERDSESRGYCSMHRWRMRTRGEPGPAGNIRPGREPAPKAKCSVDGCERDRRAASEHCHLHNERLRRTGEVGPPRPTRVRGVVRPGKDGYRRITRPDGSRVLEHVHVMEQHLGRRLVPGENVHHKHGMKADNSIEHLELWLVSQPSGQRVTDLMEYIAEYHADAMAAMLAARKAG